MPLFLEELNVLRKERAGIKKGELTPTYSLIVNSLILIIAFALTVFFIFPWLIRIFHVSIGTALFLSLGSFIVISIILGQIMAIVIGFRRFFRSK